jgi:hypothetical protein
MCAATSANRDTHKCPAGGNRDRNAHIERFTQSQPAEVLNAHHFRSIAELHSSRRVAPLLNGARVPTTAGVGAAADVDVRECSYPCAPGR